MSSINVFLTIAFSMTEYYQSRVQASWYIQCAEEFFNDTVPEEIKQSFKVLTHFTVFGVNKVLLQALYDTSFPERVGEQNWTQHENYFWGCFTSLFFKK